eukprot:TRINITY_DN3269_c0_g1_i2.p1 TRINITY_DN3269_c0_g1~~TRINITY_DN3269_c0_g1_i2.p1  ORF type:complete len:257 (+),score=20.45 TRINITY_DN3269_c0_g1_i2:126-896(+)
MNMIEERRIRLIELSHKYNFIIVADEVYQLVNFGDYIPPKPLVYFDYKYLTTNSCTNHDLEDSEGSYGKVISLGSFSKIMSPGLRLGWIQSLNQSLIKKIKNSGELLSGGNTNVVPTIGASLIDMGLLEEQITIYNRIYQSRTELGIRLLKKYFGNENSIIKCHIPEVHGGYFVWVTFPSHINTKDVLDHCKTKYFVEFKPGHIFCPQDDDCHNADGTLKHSNSIRFCFIKWNESEIEEGMERFSKAMETFVLINK